MEKSKHTLLIAAFLFVLSGAGAVAIVIASKPHPAISINIWPNALKIDASQAADARSELFRAIVERDAKPSDFAIGGDAATLANILQKIELLRSSPGEASQTSKSLYVAILDTSPAQPEKVEPANLVELNLAEAGDAAVLVVANRPTIFKVEGAAKEAHAKIAVESPAAFDIANNHPKLLAGFHSGAFGQVAASSDDYTDVSDRTRTNRLCQMLRGWGALFNVEIPKIGIWIIKDPARIYVRQNGLSQTALAEARSSDVQSHCSPPGATANRVIEPLPAPIIRRPSVQLPVRRSPDGYIPNR